MFVKRSLLLVVLGSSLALSGCGKKSSDSKSDGGGSLSSDPDIHMTGALNLSGTTATLALTADTYNLYCVTFTDSPLSCKIDVTVDSGKGQFDGTCSNFAKAAFGCFLRQDSKTLATLEFDSDTTLVAGGGDLVFDVAYDETTGKAVATINKDKSSALGSAVDQFAKANETKVPDLTGSWKLNCKDNGEFTCPAGGDKGGPQDGEGVYFKQFQAGDQTKVGVWQSKVRHDVCISTDELKPNFFMKLSDKQYSFDFTSKDKLEASADDIFKNLPADVKGLISQASDDAATARYKWCANGGTAPSDIQGFNPCEVINDGGPYNGKTAGYRSEVRRALVELLGSDSQNQDQMCQQFTIPSDFTFDKCSTQPMPSVCFSMQNISQQLALKVSGGKLVKDATKSLMGLGVEMAVKICPTAETAFEASTHDGTAFNTFKTDCQNEFAGLSTALDQAQRINDAQKIFQPVSINILCSSGNDTVVQKLKDAVANSCIPQVFFDQICDDTGCRPAMRCPGSTADGKCFDDQGNFAGRIPGQMAVMDLKPRIGGAFELSNIAADTYKQFDPQTQKAKDCHFVHSIVINGHFSDDNNFDAIFTQGEKNDCEGGDSSSSASGGQTASAPGGGGNQTFGMSFSRQP